MKIQSPALQAFFRSEAFGVAGASRDRSKFGNRVLRKYLEHQLKVYPVNPKESQIEGIACLASVLDLPEQVKSLSIITPPEVTERVVEEGLRKGIRNFWMQPGAESPEAVRRCVQQGANCIADGTCILVVLGSA